MCPSSHPAIPLSRHPHLNIIAPWGDHYDVTFKTCRERSEDHRTLNRGVDVKGMTMHFDCSVLMGDTPVQQVSDGSKVGGNHKCLKGFTCLTKVCLWLQPYCNPTKSLLLTHLLTYYPELRKT